MIRLVRIGLMSSVLLALSAAPALAAHTHVMQVGNGRCVILAQNGGEENVVLPVSVFEHNPNVDAPQTPGRMHPLHVLVHMGVPGDHNALAVYRTTAGSNLCVGGYLGNK